jgi:hypothetical protein
MLEPQCCSPLARPSHCNDEKVQPGIPALQTRAALNFYSCCSCEDRQIAGTHRTSNSRHDAALGLHKSNRISLHCANATERRSRPGSMPQSRMLQSSRSFWSHSEFFRSLASYTAAAEKYRVVLLSIGSSRRRMTRCGIHIVTVMKRYP